MQKQDIKHIINNFVVWNKKDSTLNKVKYIFFIFCFYMFIFQFTLQDNIRILKYWDEIYALIFFPLIFLKLLNNKNKNKLKKADKYILLSAIIIITIGIFGNVIFQYQKFNIAIKEILIVFKFLLSFYVTKMIFSNLHIYENEKIANHAKLIAIFLLILIILDYMFGLFPQHIRYGLKTEQLFFGHPTGLAAIMIFNLALLLYTSKSKRKNIYVAICIFIIASTLRAKALAFAVIFIILYYWMILKNRKIGIKLIFAIIIICCLVASKQILYYFVQEPNTARSVLLDTSFKIANDCFPIGSGFATYGTYLSGESYSKIYQIYNIHNIYGMSKDYNDFISDSFWPAIIGQFGYIGLLMYIVILLMMYLKIHDKYNKNKEVYFAALLPFLYLIIASTAESAFLHTMSVSMFFAISIILNTKSSVKSNIEEKNIILIDFKDNKDWKFKDVLEKETNLKWKVIETVSNNERKNKLSNIIRYLKYFLCPFSIFLDKEKYKNIIAWQQFYGLIYAFYCRLFHSKKYNKLVVMTFIYKKKDGMIGKIYYKFMKYIVQSKYIDKFVCFSKKECEDYSTIFNVPKEKFEFCTLGIEKINVEENVKNEKFILSCGRSNRDYEFLYETLKNTEYNVRILSDECNLKNTKNITIYNNVFGEEFYKMLSESYLVVIPLVNENISSGQLVVLQAMQMGKPVIVINSITIADYIQDGINGIIIEKDKDILLKKISELYKNTELYGKISLNEKKSSIEKFSVEALGKQISQIVKTKK